MTSGDSLRAPVWQRLWLYQAERFPVFAHAATVVVFSTAIGAAAAGLLGLQPGIIEYLVAACCVFFVFLVLRILDEFKDAETDRRFRPERPVPRGLVSLRLLSIVGGMAAVLSIALSAAFLPPALLALLLVWIWAALMAVEFFVPKALKQRPVLYMISHMMIMPLLACFLAIAIGASVNVTALVTLTPLLLFAFANGSVLEVGRKLWAVENERPGVESYSSTFGVRRALLGWLFAALLSAAATAATLVALDRVALAVAAVTVVTIIIAAAAFRYGRNPDNRGQKLINAASGLCVLTTCAALIMAAAFNGVFG